MAQKIIILILIVTVILIAIMTKTKPTKTVTINDTSFQAQIADTEETRNQGLMQVAKLKNNQGMLFIFEEPQPLFFWMKNTLIPLDIIFADQNRHITNIVHSAQPCPDTDSCHRYQSSQNAQYVLEINAGLAKKYQFSPQDLLKFNLK